MNVYLVGIGCFIAGVIVEWFLCQGKIEYEIQGIHRLKESLRAEYNRRGEVAPFDRKYSWQGKSRGK